MTARHRERFVSQLRQELMYQRDIGWVSASEFDKIFDALRDPILAQRVIVEANGRLKGIDWGSLVDWISNNWATIAKIVLTFALIFLQEPPGADEQLWSED